jgi:hypothetical protein
MNFVHFLFIILNLTTLITQCKYCTTYKNATCVVTSLLIKYKLCNNTKSMVNAIYNGTNAEFVLIIFFIEIIVFTEFLKSKYVIFVKRFLP